MWPSLPPAGALRPRPHRRSARLVRARAPAVQPPGGRQGSSRTLRPSPDNQPRPATEGGGRPRGGQTPSTAGEGSGKSDRFICFSGLGSGSNRRSVRFKVQPKGTATARMVQIGKHNSKEGTYLSWCACRGPRDVRCPRKATARGDVLAPAGFEALPSHGGPCAAPMSETAGPFHPAGLRKAVRGRPGARFDPAPVH